MSEQTGQTRPQQTMEEMRDVLTSGLGPDIPTRLVDQNAAGEEVVEVRMPEGGTYVRQEADGSFGRAAHLGNGTPIELNNKTQAVEVTPGQLGCRVAYSYNQSGTTDILTIAAGPEEVRTRVRQAQSDPQHSGVQAGTAQIFGITEINGRPVAEVEEGLRDHWSEPWEAYVNNRLGRGESLIDTLAADNELVTAAGFTHEQLAAPLSSMVAQWAKGTHAPEQPIEYNGGTFRLEGDVARGLEDSAVSGKQTTITLLRVVNVTTGAALQFDALSPAEIAQHGFYGGTGEGANRRVSPGAIVTVFNLQPQNG